MIVIVIYAQITDQCSCSPPVRNAAASQSVFVELKMSRKGLVDDMANTVQIVLWSLGNQHHAGLQMFTVL